MENETLEWTCPKCETNNTGDHCVVCGTLKTEAQKLQETIAEAENEINEPVKAVRISENDLIPVSAGRKVWWILTLFFLGFWTYIGMISVPLFGVAIGIGLIFRLIYICKNWKGILPKKKKESHDGYK